MSYRLIDMTMDEKKKLLKEWLDMQDTSKPIKANASAWTRQVLGLSVVEFERMMNDLTLEDMRGFHDPPG